MYLGRVVCTNFFLLFLLVFLSLLRCDAKEIRSYECDKPSSCDQILNISFPFGLKGDHKRNCRRPIFHLECENNKTIFYSINAVKHFVLAIDYSHFYSTIRVVDAGLQKDNCSSLPSRSFDPYDYLEFEFYPQANSTVLYLSCENPVDSSLYIKTGPCIDGVRSSNSLVKSQYYSYVLLGYAAVGDIAHSCRIEMVVKSSSPAIYNENLSYADIHNELLHGFELYFHIDDYSCGIILSNPSSLRGMPRGVQDLSP